MEWEQVFGGNWLARIGVVALLMGIGFFLKLSFDNNWIGPVTRVSLGGAGSGVLIGAGEFWRRRYPIYAQALSGGAVALAYLAAFASFGIYDLIGLYPAIALLFAVSAGSAWLALRFDSMALAIMGILGAYSAPFILGAYSAGGGLGAAGPTVQLPVYLLAVALGVMALATQRNWRWFVWLGFLGTVAAFQAWLVAYGQGASLLTKEGSLTVLFLLLLGSTSLPALLRRRATDASSAVIAALNAAWYLGLSYGLLWGELREWLGGFTILTAGLYAGISFAARRRLPGEPLLRWVTLGLSLVFVTVAVPVQFKDTMWTTLVWNAEALALLLLSLRFSSPLMRAGAYVALVCVAVRLLAFETVVEDSAFKFFANQRLGAFAAGVGTLYASAYALWRWRGLLTEWEQQARSVFPILLVSASFFSLWALSAELVNQYPAPAHNAARHLSLTGLWTAYGIAVLAVTSLVRARADYLRAAAYVVLGLAVLWLLAVDTFLAMGDVRPALNWRFGAFLGGMAAMYAAAFLLWRQRSGLAQWEQWAVGVYPVFLGIGSLLTLWGVSTEIVTAFGEADQQNARNLSLTAFWAVYAGVLLAVGITTGSRVVRWAAIGFLAVPVAKVFVYDVFALERVYRVVAFVGLGVLLLAGGYAYQRFGKAIRGFLRE